jgi:flagellar hook protein FlgE
VTFKEGFAQLLQGASRPPGDHGGINPIQIGLGMQIGSIDTMFSQGNLETTGLNTDLAIQGDSFFVVAKGAEHFYTRSGNFQLDAGGRLVSPTNGFVVQGRMAVNGVFQDGIQDIILPFGQKTAAKPTDELKLGGNLDASAPIFTGTFDVGSAAAGLKEGGYRYYIDVKGADGKAVQVETYTTARVDGITYGQDGALLTAGPLRIKPGSIVKIAP